MVTAIFAWESWTREVQMNLSGAGSLCLDRVDADNIDVRISGSAGVTVCDGQVLAG